jgi:hypothetical protein
MTIVESIEAPTDETGAGGTAKNQYHADAIVGCLPGKIIGDSVKRENLKN